MIEMTLVILILGTFVFPIQISAGCLGLYTTWFFYRCYETFKNQPVEGKKVLSSAALAFLINFFISAILAGLLAMLIQILIFDHFYLFIFNFIFCFLISIRWFDFSYILFQRWAIANDIFKTDEKRFFVVCKGFKNATGFGLSPVFIDAGLLFLEEDQVRFEGSFFQKIFGTKNILNIEKKSLEKIKIFINPDNANEARTYLISLKSQFYPFRSRPNRDMIFDHLTSGLKTQAA